MSTETSFERRKRLDYRSRYRGFREADLLFSQFADRHLAKLSEQQLDQYEALLNEADQDVYGWVIGTRHAPARHENEVLGLLRQYEPST